MEKQKSEWSKTELQIYVLLLCANADKKETKEELDMIKSKVSEKTFDSMYKIFKNDSEEERLEKVATNVQLHYYTQMELAEFRREMFKIFFSDCNFSMLEKRLDWTLDNILY